MRLLIWAVTVLVLLFGTLMVGLAAAAAGWLAGAGEQVAQSAQAAAQMPLPEWLAWIDPALVPALRGLMQWSAGMLAGSAPWLGPLLGLVPPVLWTAWVVAAALILMLAVGLHLLAGRWGRGGAGGPRGGFVAPR
ncbi:hypothetical protein [Ramlibacter tataouinensis]|uniref:Uncharacterized protein n=1 Tax=Ramlibacter tataouinensis (strain ATCC BAA-407 / DSM 14655 / LMG 21543 / TTB310) TaxID=365046 RepID=F5Y0K7_RAMTT|nr:hypothetical protein [Ramlibacter tataouinensis]AEG93413.1 Conserved hypothetical protein [Ramlibacter tataouinensis TTB310]